MTINGDFNTDTARLIQIQLKKCVGHDYCKTDDEMREFFRNKWMMFLYNQKLFDSRYYNEESIKPLAKM